MGRTKDIIFEKLRFPKRFFIGLLGCKHCQKKTALLWRFFQLHHSFAIRILFWWGRSFIITLHLSGRFKQEFEERIFERLDDWAAAGYHFCIHEDQWVHHLGDDNYVSLTGADRKELMGMNATRSFLKMAKKIELGQINGILPVLHKEYKKLLDLLKD